MADTRAPACYGIDIGGTKIELVASETALQVAWRKRIATPQGDYNGFLQAVETPDATQSSCPAFGGPDLSTLFVTTALENMSAEARARHPASGQVFAFPAVARGLAEPQVLMPPKDG